jgi:pilus assembly protein CpaE
MLDLPTDRISESDLAEVLWRGPAEVDILLAPPRIEMAEMVLIRDLEKTISLMRRLYDLVIVDTGVGLDELTLALLDQADTILEIVTYDATTIRNTVAVAETFQKIGYSASKVQYLVNRADAAAGIDPADLRTALGREPEYRIRSEGQIVGPASNQGAPFVTAEPEAGVSRDLVEMTRQLLGVTDVKAKTRESRKPVLAGAAR